MNKYTAFSVLLVLVFSMLGIALPVQSQNKKQRTIYLQGTVKDSFTKVMLKAHITVMDADSAVIDTTTAWQWDRDGGWYLQIPARPGKLIIKGRARGMKQAISTSLCATLPATETLRCHPCC